jgi:uncharacterized protein with GYD domain
MPLYQIQFSYTPEAWARLASNPEDRSTEVGALLENLGARLISFYYYIGGKYDGVLTLEAPDKEAALAAAIAAFAAGGAKVLDMVELLSVEEGIEAMRRAGEQIFRAPGA